MSFDWQTAAVLLVVGVACAYLARRAWLSIARRKAASCGSCPTCPAEGGARDVELFALTPAGEATRRTDGLNNGAQSATDRK